MGNHGFWPYAEVRHHIGGYDVVSVTVNVRLADDFSHGLGRSKVGSDDNLPSVAMPYLAAASAER